MGCNKLKSRRLDLERDYQLSEQPWCDLKTNKKLQNCCHICHERSQTTKGTVVLYVLQKIFITFNLDSTIRNMTNEKAYPWQ